MNGHGGQSGKQSILALPLAKSLPEYLTPDPLVPSVSALLSLSSYASDKASPGSEEPTSPAYQPRPSNLRRSRQVAIAHFTYVTPLPVTFPYAVKPSQVKPRKVSGEAVGDGSAVKNGAQEDAEAASSAKPPSLNVEDFLASLEPSLDDCLVPVTGKQPAGYSSEDRREALGKPMLAGLSHKCIAEILPTLDVGDSWEYLEKGKDAPGDNSALLEKGKDNPGDNAANGLNGAESMLGDASSISEAARARAELTQVLAGHVIRLQPSSSESKGFAPWSLAYAGHQFGSWAGQLGDGRAISILTTPAKWPDYHGDTFYPPLAELQLKGAGRTPYSRFADGLAVLRSSVREYLGSEAIAALGIPTSRALSLVHLPDVQVRREEMETAAVVCRVAPSWLRIGSFELLWSRDNWDELRDLVSYAGKVVFGIGQEGQQSQDQSLAAAVLRETARRNAKTFAGWQAVGFMHGVLNTDNISIAGLTIDYGPYAFMDVYDSNHICNHSDGEGRYSYRNQPPIGVEAIHRMGAALSELIGHELELAGSTGKMGEASPGWAQDASKLENWGETGTKVVHEIATEFMTVHIQEYRCLMAKKLGLAEAKQTDFAELFDPLLSLMQSHHMDFAHTFRLLSQFKTVQDTNFSAFLDTFAPKSAIPQYLHETCHNEWTEWFAKYQKRLEESEASAGLKAEDRRSRIAAANPRFILRQWVLEEAISRLRKSNDVGFLRKVLNMAVDPFNDYGEAVVGQTEEACPTADAQEERRLCGTGPKTMLGFQCSCSS